MGNDRFICPACGSRKLALKYEARYVYSYILDSDAPGLKNTDEILPFLYDGREQKEARSTLNAVTAGHNILSFSMKQSREWTSRLCIRVASRTGNRTQISCSVDMIAVDNVNKSVNRLNNTCPDCG